MLELPTVKEIVSRYNIVTQRSLGQNFLFDLNITDKIVRCSGNLSNANVLEIGPGPGGLTRSILASDVRHVIVIEKDRRCVEALNDYLVPHSQDRLQIIEKDALVFDYGSFDKEVKVIANLPYNVATKLLFCWLDHLSVFSSFTLMFQKEVANRICAKVNSKEYGRLAVRTQWLCEVEHHFDIPPEAFYPAPKVTSSVISLIPREKPLYKANSAVLDTVCRAVFGQRRKTLRVSLKQLTCETDHLLDQADIDKTKRPEQLTLEEFCQLARTYEEIHC